MSQSCRIPTAYINTLKIGNVFAEILGIFLRGRYIFGVSFVFEKIVNLVGFHIRNKRVFCGFYVVLNNLRTVDCSCFYVTHGAVVHSI